MIHITAVSNVEVSITAHSHSINIDCQVLLRDKLKIQAKETTNAIKSIVNSAAPID